MISKYYGILGITLFQHPLQHVYKPLVRIHQAQLVSYAAQDCRLLLVAVTVDIVDHCQWAMEEVKTTGTTKVKPPTGTAAPIVNSDDDDDVVPSNSRFLH